MTGDRNTHRKYSAAQVLGIATIAALTGGLFIWYLTAAREGLWHMRKGEAALVAPDFVADEKTLRRVPDFTLPDRAGTPVKLSGFSGVDVLIVNIWSAGCPACREEIPSLTELDRRLSHRDGVELLTIAIADGWDDVASYFPQGTNLRILFDGEDRVGKGVFHTEKYPETFILDRNRNIRARFDGLREWHSDAFVTWVASFRQ